jgi:hypothetical protein
MDIYMHRASKEAKKITLEAFESERSKTIAEMKARLRAYAAVETCKLTNGQPIWSSFCASIEMARTKHHYWQSVDTMLSFFDIVLLVWASGTGEMRNHQALGTHTDGNKSHYIESYTVWGKVPVNDKRSSTKIVEEMVPAKLGLPHYGLALLSRCGRDVWQLQLKNTMHSADPSRNMYNWSWVHGP